MVYLTETPRQPFGEFVGSLYESGWLNAYLHLWFLGHLVLYSVGYVAWRHVADHRGSGSRRTWSPPSHAAIVGFIICLALVSWVVRIWYPVDEWVPLFFLIPAEPAHLPHYLSLFGLGVIAYRGDWLRRLPTSFGAIWLSIGLVASTGYYVVDLLASDSATDDVVAAGFTARSALYSTWEALICAAMVVGLVVVGRTAFRRRSRLLAAMAAASYARLHPARHVRRRSPSRTGGCRPSDFAQVRIGGGSRSSARVRSWAPVGADPRPGDALGHDSPRSGSVGTRMPSPRRPVDAPDAATEPGRRRDLDAMRVFVVAGLVLFHSARIFDTGDFYVKHDPASEVVSVLVSFAALWGMPLLFIVSGMGISYSLRTRTTRQFAVERTGRLLVPLVFGVMVIVPPQIWTRLRSDPTFDESYLAFLPRFLDVRLELGNFPFVVGDDPATGLFEWGHLWFLVLLFA